MASPHPKIDRGMIERIDYTNLIGLGGFGFVYKAGETVAAKVVSFREHSRTDIEDAEKCLKLPCEHPNILALYGILEDSDNKYVFMEFCELGNLRIFFKKTDLATKTKVDLMTQIANGISYLHTNGIIHRDIKPENILLKHADVTPEVPYCVKLSDFGLSKFIEEGQHSTMSSDVGTIAFKAPEFWQRDKDDKLQYKKVVDVFAAGLTYLAMLQSDTEKKLAPGIERVKSLDPSEQEQAIGYTMYIRMKNKQPIPDIIADEGDEMTQRVKVLIRKMIEVKPEDRVEAEEVHATLSSILQ